MALQAKVDTLDDVPEGVRDFYEESDEGYRLAVEGVEFPEEVKGLKSALQKERDARKKEERRLAELREQIPEDFDPGRWEELTEAEKKREREKAEKKGEYEKVIAQKEEFWQEKLEEEKQARQTVEQQLEQHIVDGAIMAAASEHDAWAHLLPDYAKRFVQVKEVDGKRVPVVVDEDGDRRLNNEGDTMSISELVAWMKEEERYQPLFKPSGASGGGAAAGGGAGGPGTQKSIKEMSDQEKQDFIDEHGIEAFRENLRSAYAA